ncbi:MAG: glucose-6-phosphate isomerase [Rhodothermia bacterium]|nr:MAG: glucose-6-phosphate isomerase [Rhodothermia bacterium]
MIHLDHTRTDGFLNEVKWNRLSPRVVAAHEALLNESGAGNEWLGWRRILMEPNDALLEEITRASSRIRSEADVLLCIGIGGSYLGAKAIIEALGPNFPPTPEEQEDASSATPEIIFVGHHLSGAFMRDLLDYLDGRSVFAIVVSKSGTTLEPAIAFRFVRQWMESRFDDTANRIIVITDPESGALNAFADEKEYSRFVIPRDIGGRFSVLSPAGLLAIAVAGIDIRSLFYGAVAMLSELSDSDGNMALSYAGIRHYLLNEGYTTEVLAHFEPRLSGFSSWWQQLFGESEGKNHSGIFPTVATYSTDLHSIGQYLQEGRRDLFETFLIITDEEEVTIPPDPGDLDGLNYLSGQALSAVNESAYQGTSCAHEEGGVPNMTFRMDVLSEENLGRCIYLFQHAVAVSGYLLGVNPFDQPGVEAYKKAMFSLLGRP